MKKTITIFTALFLLLCSVAFAQPALPFTIYGQVINDSIPVVGASVTVTDENTGEFLTDITDASGWYIVNLGNMLSGSSEGDTITVEATLNSYGGNATAVRVQDSPQKIDVTLSLAVPPAYPINITEIKILDVNKSETTTIIPGAWYYIQVKNENLGEEPIESLQIIQIGEGSQAPLVPLNLASVRSTINAGNTSEITIGFELPASASSSTVYTVDVFNWNDWASQPGGGVALSESRSATFQAA